MKTNSAETTETKRKPAEPRPRRGEGGEVNLFPGSEGLEDQRFRKKESSEDQKKENRKKKHSDDQENGGRSTRRRDGPVDFNN